MPLDDILKMSDIVTLHIPLTDQTKRLIDKSKLALMKETSVLINTAVGPIVDNDALAEALHNGTIAGAGLDRVDMEPPVPTDYPLLKAPNTVLVPHVGYATDEAMIRRAKITSNNIEKWLKGEQENIVLRSEEHTSELQSRGQLVCRLLLKKKNTQSDLQAPTIRSNTHRPRITRTYT